MATKTIKLVALALILSPALAAAASTGFPIPDSTYTVGASFTVYDTSGNSWNCSAGADRWLRIAFYDDLSPLSDWLPMLNEPPYQNTSYTFNAIAPAGTYGNNYRVQCRVGSNDPTLGDSVFIGGSVTFENPPAPVSYEVTIPTSTASVVLLNITNQFKDTGTLTLIALIAAIPLSFYVIDRLILLMPRDRQRSKKTSEK